MAFQKLRFCHCRGAPRIDCNKAFFLLAGNVLLSIHSHRVLQYVTLRSTRNDDVPEASASDMVHEFLLRKTQMSSPLISGGSIKSRPLPNITPAIADCRYKVPLTPRLHGSFIINVIYQLCQVKLITYLTPVSCDTAFELLWLNWCK